MGEKDPVKEKRAATRQTHRGPDGKGAEMSVWAGQISFESPKPVELFASLDSSLIADMTGEVIDDLGNAVVRYHLAATLYSPKGEPVGTAQAAAELQPGRQWIELAFYGLIFHDRKVAGPYRLGTVALSTTTRMPNALNDLVENAHVTRAWRIEQMTAAPYGNPHFLEAAERLESDAARSQGKP